MIYDYNTKNDSFILVYEQLKKEGIKNNKFHLILYDEKLRNVDPFDENLSLETIARIKKECLINVWYYIREIVRIPVPSGVSKFILHRGNLAELFCLNLNLNTIIELPRQHYKTYSAVAYYSWVYVIRAKNYSMIFGNKQLADAQLNIKRLNDLIELLPSYLKTHLDPKKDSDNINLISIASTNNSIKAMSTGRDKASADKLGRGMTVPSAWIDEFAFLLYNDITYKAMKPALNTAIDFAKKSKSPYGLLLSTTPNNLDQPEGKFCYSMIQKSAKFDEILYDHYDWSVRDDSYIKEFIDKNSSNNFIYIEFSYLQLGKDENWLKQQIKELEGDMLLVKRELLLQWTYASNVSPFSEDQLSVLESYADKNPVSKIMLNSYIIDVIKQPKNLINKNWVLSIDVGGGLGIDASAFTLIDPATYEPMMKFSNNMISVPDFAKFIELFVNVYVPNAVIIPERNNAGIALIQLLEDSTIKNNLFYEIKEREAEEKVDLNQSIWKSSNKKKTKKETRVFGISTTPKTRDIMINQILFMIVNEKPYLVNNKELFENIRTLYRNKKGK